MLGAKRRLPSIALGAGVLATLAAGVPDGSGGPATAAAAHGHVKRCTRRQVQVVVGKRSSCVPARTFTRGVPRGGDALAIAIGRISRARGGGHSITAVLGHGAAAIGRWEDGLVGAGRAAQRSRGVPIARDSPPSPAVDDQTLRLQVRNPPGSASTTEAHVHTDSGANGLTLNDTASTTGHLAVTVGPITVLPGPYQFSENAHVTGPFCPTAAGVVQEVGHFTGTRMLTIGGRTTTETFTVMFTITGRVNRAARLTGYDVEVSVLSTDAAGHDVRVLGSANKLTPGSSLQSIAPSRVTLPLRSRRLADDRAFVTDAVNFARDEGLVYLQRSETVFDKEASCLRIATSPSHVIGGTEAAVAIRVFSRITGKQVDADLTLRPSGGAQAKPASTHTTPDHPAIVDIKMPATPRGRSVDPSAIAAAAPPSVAITGLSERGRAVGTIDSQALPVALVFDSTIVDAAPPANSAESGSITYHVHSVVPLAAQDASAGSGPIGPGSAPLRWVSVSGQANKSGLIACSPTDQPYSLVQTATAVNDGTLRLTRSSNGAAGGGAAGLTLRIQMSPSPTNRVHSVFQGTCEPLWAPFDATTTGSSWYHQFLDHHLSAVPAGDPCLRSTADCSFDISGWQPGPSGVYATWHYSRASVIGCPFPGYSCFGSNSTETTTVELREAS